MERQSGLPERGRCPEAAIGRYGGCVQKDAAVDRRGKTPTPMLWRWGERGRGRGVALAIAKHAILP